MIPDYHTHTHFSTDSEASAREHIETAIALGMPELCFTDHTDFDYPPENGETLFRFNPFDYFDEIGILKREYASKIKIKIGIELGLNPSIRDRNKALTIQIPFDFVIGSSHIVDGLDPYYPEYWEGITAKEGVEKYFNAILTNVKAGNDYDVYGHLDYVRRYIPQKNFLYNEFDYYEITEAIMKTIIENGHGIELNTRGLTYGENFFAPTINLIRRYHHMGGEIITVGSDAHFSENVGYSFKQASDILSEIGFKYITVFNNRKAQFLPL